MQKLFTYTLLLVLTAIAPVASADVLDDILERGTIRVGVSEIAPWTLRSRGGEFVGFEIDVANKIAADMRVQAEYKVYDWEDLIPALDNGEIDIIAGGLAITPAHALQVNFSRPLALSGISIATNLAKTRSVDSLKTLDSKDYTIAVVAGTLSANAAHTFFEHANVVAFPDADAAEKQVIDGRAHAYVATLPEVNFLSMRHADEIDVPMTDPLVASSEGLAVKKGEQELLNFLNAWVTAHHSDRWLESTRDYWFKSMDWMSDAKK